MGQNARKAKPTANPADNNGFDDERGDYLWNLHDHIAFRYEILGVLGISFFVCVVILLCSTINLYYTSPSALRF